MVENLHYKWRPGEVKKKSEARRQTPKPPFSYIVEAVSVENKVDAIELKGTLTRPRQGEIKATAILVTGSGPQDRDETLFNHKPFAVIADYLTKAGYAVLRLDDRGVGESGGNFQTATTFDFATDIGAAIDFIKTRSDLNGIVGLIGHSEGGMVASVLSAQRKDLDFVIQLASPSIDSTELLAEQYVAIDNSKSDDELKSKIYENYRVAFTALANREKRDEIPKLVSEKLRKNLSLNEVPADRVNSILGQLISGLTTPWFDTFLKFRPSEHIKKITTPTLFLFAEKDIQVLAKSNSEKLATLIETHNLGHIEYKTIPKLNHLFQSCHRCDLKEYSELEETFSPLALTAISNWLDQRFNLKR